MIKIRLHQIQKKIIQMKVKMDFMMFKCQKKEMIQNFNQEFNLKKKKLLKNMKIMIFQLMNFMLDFMKVKILMPYF